MTSDEVAKLLADASSRFVPQLANALPEDIGVVIVFTNERLRRAAMPLVGGENHSLASLVASIVAIAGAPTCADVDSWTGKEKLS